MGFAYQWHPTTVVRGGLGRFVQASFDTGVSGQANGFNTSTNAVVTNENFRTLAPGFSLAAPFSGGLNAPVGNSQRELTFPGQQSTYRDPNFGRPYTDTASAQVQQQIRDFLVEIGGTLNVTHGISVDSGYQVNQLDPATWQQVYSPTFSAAGRPDDTLPANVTVANPFYHVNGFRVTDSQYTATSVAANQLLRPNPIRGDIALDSAKGRSTYYALQTKVDFAPTRK